MNESIYQISERYNNVLALLDDENVSQDDIATALAEVMDDVSSKGENGIVYFRKLQGTIDAAKAEKKKIDAYVKALEGRKKRLEGAYMKAMEMMKMKSIMTARGELKIKKNPPAVIIDDVVKIPTQYMRQKVEITPDKEAIKAALKSGEIIDGAHMEQAVSLSY